MQTMEDIGTADNAHPAEHQAVRDMIEYVAERIGYDEVGQVVEPVEWRGRSGFIPYTEGGWDGVVTFELHSEASYGTKALGGYLDSDYRDMLDDFRSSRDLPDDWDPYASDQDTAEWDEHCTRWQYEGDGCYWFVKARALYYSADHHRNVTGSDEYLFCLGVCTDFNYGRDSISWLPGAGTDWLWEETIPVVDLHPDRLSMVADAMLEVWRNA